MISRLSTNVFRGRTNDVDEISGYLGATYVLSGGYVVNAGKLLVTAELLQPVRIKLYGLTASAAKLGTC